MEGFWNNYRAPLTPRGYEQSRADEGQTYGVVCDCGLGASCASLAEARELAREHFATEQHANGVAQLLSIGRWPNPVRIFPEATSC
jgi:hypothetical protein